MPRSVVVDRGEVVLTRALGVATEVDDRAEVVVGPRLLVEVPAALGDGELALHETLTGLQIASLARNHGQEASARHVPRTSPSVVGDLEGS